MTLCVEFPVAGRILVRRVQNRMFKKVIIVLRHLSFLSCCQRIMRRQVAIPHAPRWLMRAPSSVMIITLARSGYPFGQIRDRGGDNHAVYAFSRAPRCAYSVGIHTAFCTRCRRALTPIVESRSMLMRLPLLSVPFPGSQSQDRQRRPPGVYRESTDVRCLPALCWRADARLPSQYRDRRVRADRGT